MDLFQEDNDALCSGHVTLEARLLSRKEGMEIYHRQDV